MKKNVWRQELHRKVDRGNSKKIIHILIGEERFLRSEGVDASKEYEVARAVVERREIT